MAQISNALDKAARDDYRHVSNDRQMRDSLPKAWNQLISDEDDLLLEIVADRVESLCGFKPDPDMVATFLKRSVQSHSVATPQTRQVRSTVKAAHQAASNAVTATAAEQALTAPRSGYTPRAVTPTSESIGFSFEGEFHHAHNAIDTLRLVFKTLMDRDDTFAERFAGLPKHGRSRRYLARDPADLYPGRKDLAQEHSLKLSSKSSADWWLSTNHSKQTIARIISMACDVAQVGFGQDLIVHLGRHES